MANPPEWMTEFSRNLFIEQQRILDKQLGPIRADVTHIGADVQEIKTVLSKLEAKMRELDGRDSARHDAKPRERSNSLPKLKADDDESVVERKSWRAESAQSNAIGSNHRKKVWRRASTLPAEILKDYIDTVGESHPAAQALLHVHEPQTQRQKPIFCKEWYHWIRFQLHSLLEEPRSSTSAFLVSVFMMVAVLTSVISFMLESIPSYSPEVDPQNEAFWFKFDLFFNTYFTADYFVRFWSTSFGYVAFLTDIANMVDVFSVLPFWLERLPFSAIGGNTACFRVFRLLRIFRIFKLARFSVHLRIIAESFVFAIDPLILLSTFVGMAVFLFSVLLWFVERGDWDPTLNCFAQAKEMTCSPFQSIPGSMYWAVTTMTTVGYGDAVPVTHLGRAISCFAMVCGILVIAMPVSILSSSFQKCYESVKDDFKLEKVEDEFKLSCAIAKSEETADAETFQLLCEEVRDSKDKLAEIMPEIRALLRKWAIAAHHSKSSQDLITSLCNAIEKNVDNELSLLSEVLEDYALDVTEQYHSNFVGG